MSRVIYHAVMHLKRAVLILGAFVAIVLFGAFAVWLFEFLNQFSPVLGSG